MFCNMRTVFVPTYLTPTLSISLFVLFWFDELLCGPSCIPRQGITTVGEDGKVLKKDALVGLVQQLK